MDIRELALLVGTIDVVYGERSPFHDEATRKQAMMIWNKMLEDVCYADAEKALADHIKNSVYPPTIADMRKIANSKTDISPGEAWQLTVRAIGRYGRDRQDAALEILPESVRVAVKSCGWRYLCNADTENAKRAFMREYAESTGRIKPADGERKALNG